jgi:hypothetical protein
VLQACSHEQTMEVRMRSTRITKALILLGSGAVLLQAGGCSTAFAGAASSILTTVLTTVVTSYLGGLLGAALGV